MSNAVRDRIEVAGGTPGSPLTSRKLLTCEAAQLHRCSYVACSATATFTIYRRDRPWSVRYGILPSTTRFTLLPLGAIKNGSLCGTQKNENPWSTTNPPTEMTLGVLLRTKEVSSVSSEQSELMLRCPNARLGPPAVFRTTGLGRGCIFPELQRPRRTFRRPNGVRSPCP